MLFNTYILCLAIKKNLRIDYCTSLLQYLQLATLNRNCPLVSERRKQSINAVTICRWTVSPVPLLIIERNDFPINNAAITRFVHPCASVSFTKATRHEIARETDLWERESEEMAKVSTETAKSERRKVVDIIKVLAFRQPDNY